MAASVGKDLVRLSAVVPNFNHGAVIGEAIRALANQLPAADEIIVVDDGSTDNSIEVLDRLRQEYPTIRVVALPKNQGAIFALNRGLQEARGKYVYFGAADDLVRPGLFSSMLAMTAQYPQAAFSVCECVVLDTDTGKKAYRPPARPSHSPAFLSPSEVSRILRHIDNWILTGTAIVRRDLILEAGGFDGTLGSFADGYVFRRLALQHGCCFVPQVGAVWQVNSKGYSRSQAADPDASLRALGVAILRMREDPFFPAWYPAVFERRWRFGIGKIATEATPINSAVLKRLSHGPVSRVVLGGAAAMGGQVGRVIALGWLGLQERPISLLSLVRTHFERTRLKSGLQSLVQANSSTATLP